VKSGIDYFPLDVRLNTKIKLIEAEFGLTGFAIIVKLFQAIYGERGYYGEWTNEVALLFSRDVGLGRSAVSEIVDAAIKRGIFDKTLYDKYHILTSDGIQERYFEIVSRRKNVKIIREYLLTDCYKKYKNADISSVNVNKNYKNVDISQQSKVKESKVKERIVEYITPASLPTPSPSLQDFMKLYEQYCPTLYKKEQEANIDNSYKNAQILNLAVDEGFTEEEAVKLFKAAEASEWLKNKAKNIDLAWMIIKRQEIIARRYDKDFSKNNSSDEFAKREYTKEELNDMFTSQEPYEV